MTISQAFWGKFFAIIATDDPSLADLVLSKIVDRVAELEDEAEAGLLLPWQEEELAIVRELLQSIHQSRRARTH